MWSISPNRPFGSLSARRITLFVSAMLVAFFTTAAIYTTPTNAQTTTGGVATWSGETIEYDGYALERYDTPPSGGAFPNIAGTACENNGPIFYSSIYPEPIYERGNSAYQEDRYWMHVICLDENSNGTDRSEPVDATLLDYSILKASISSDEVRGGALDSRLTYSIQVLPSDGAPDIEQDNSTSCNSEHTFGLGWVICPVTRWLSSTMDQLYSILSSFFLVAPLTGDTDSTIFTVWGMVRNIANILFIIGFLIITYSQITNFGVSNYGIKRLLPRLIIAAILVNVSFWICAIAVDLSNILGVHVKSLLDSVVESVDLEGNVSLDSLSWQSVAGAALTGAVGAVAIGGAVFSLVASAGASLWFILVTLAGVLVSALVAILVLAARQALITVLIIISPLAFVAYLLPSTEKYFERWRSVFMTMLLLFPIFSLIFGGSQLAGLIIIAGALETAEFVNGEYVVDNPNFFNLIILGMVVQVAPIVITPLLIRFSGSILGRIAGIVNDPNKGLIDRTRKFAQHRHDMTKNRQLWDRDRSGNYKNRNPLAAGGRWNALREEDSANKLKAWQTGAQAAYEKDSRSHEAYRQSTLNEMIKSSGESEAKRDFARDIARSNSLQEIDVSQRVSKEEAELAESKNKTSYDAIRTKPGVADAAIRDLANRAHSVSTDTLDEQQRQSSIHLEHENVYWRDLANNAERQTYAGAPMIAEHGETRIANIVRQKQNEEREKRVNAAISNLSTVEAKLDEERAVILGDLANAGRFTSLAEDVDSRSGALRRYVARAPLKQVQTLLEEMDITMSANGDAALETLRSELAGALQKRKPLYISQTNLNKIEEGTLGTQYFGTAGKSLMIQETLNMKGFGTQTMVQADRDDLQAVRDYLRTNGINSLNADAQEALRSSLQTAFRDDRYRSQMDKRDIELGEIWNDLEMGDIPK